MATPVSNGGGQTPLSRGRLSPSDSRQAKGTMKCECGCGQEANNRFLRGHNVAVNNPAWNPLSRARMSASHTGLVQSMEQIENRRMANIRAYERDSSIRVRISRSVREDWAEFRKDPEAVVRRVLPALKALSTYGNGRRTSPERYLEKIIDGCGLPFRFNSRNIVVGGHFPDFTCTGREKALIEVFGTAWHEESEVSELQDLYSQYGYKSLILWDYELAELEEDIIVMMICGLLSSANPELAPQETEGASVETLHGAPTNVG